MGGQQKVKPHLVKDASGASLDVVFDPYQDRDIIALAVAFAVAS